MFYYPQDTWLHYYHNISIPLDILECFENLEKSSTAPPCEQESNKIIQFWLTKNLLKCSDMLPLCYYPYFHHSPSARPAKPGHFRGGLSKIWSECEKTLSWAKNVCCSWRYQAGAGQSSLCRGGGRLGRGGGHWGRREGRLSLWYCVQSDEI